MLKQAFAVVLCLASAQGLSQYIGQILPPGSGGTAEGAGGGQIVGRIFGFGPALWDGPNHKVINLGLSEYTQETLLGVGGGQQVGYGVSGSAHALLWSGSAQGAIDLHPSGYTGSWSNNTDGIHQVGAAGTGGNLNHAMLWSGNAKSAVDLHPGGYLLSEASGVWSDVQVGSVLADEPGKPEGAVLWRGSAQSMQFLPTVPGLTAESAFAVHGNQVVGRIEDVGAVLWDIDNWKYELLGEGFAIDTNGTYQVGYRGAFENARALRWSGSAKTELDLHQFLPSEVTDSQAFGIDENGTIVGVGTVVGVGSVPLVWTPVPEPSTFLALGTCTTLLILSRRRKALNDS